MITNFFYIEKVKKRKKLIESHKITCEHYRYKKIPRNSRGFFVNLNMYLIRRNDSVNNLVCSIV